MIIQNKIFLKKWNTKYKIPDVLPGFPYPLHYISPNIELNGHPLAWSSQPGPSVLRNFIPQDEILFSEIPGLGFESNPGIRQVPLVTSELTLLEHIMDGSAFQKGHHYHNHHQRHHCCCLRDNYFEMHIVIKMIKYHKGHFTSGICAAQRPIPTVEVARRRKPSWFWWS